MRRSKEWLRLAVLATAPALAVACGSSAGSAVDADGGRDARVDAGEGADSGVPLDARVSDSSAPLDGGGDAPDDAPDAAGPTCRTADGGTPPRFKPGVELSSVGASCSTEWCPPGVLGLVVADFDGDGKDDVGYLDGPDAEILLSKGHGVFGAPIDTPVATNQYAAYAMHVGDFDGDGHPDLLVQTIVARDPHHEHECTASTLTVFLGNGNGTFTAGKSTANPVKCSIYAAAVADFDGDGRADALLAGGSVRNIQSLALGPARVALMSSSGQGLTKKLDRADYSTYFVATQAVAGDFNGDGLDDFATETYGAIFVSLGQGAGAFGPASRLTAFADESLDEALTQTLFARDLDGDGYTDLIATSYGTAQVRLGGPSSLGALAAYPIGSDRVTAVADFDGDGHLDILSGLGPMTLLPGHGDGTFASTAVEFSTPHTYGGGVAVGDFDGDGFPDVLASRTGANGAGVWLFANSGCVGGDVSSECGSCLGTCTAAGCLQTLGSVSGGYVSAILVDTHDAYWSNGSEVLRTPITGGPTSVVSTENVAGIAIDDANLYVATRTTILSVPLGGGTATTLASGQPFASAVAVDATNVYWTDAIETQTGTFTGDVRRAPIAGGPVTTLATNQAYPASLAVAGGEIYWINVGCYASPSGSVVMLPVTGGTPTTLATGTSTCAGDSTELVVDATGVYATSSGGPVLRFPIGGGAPQTLAKGSSGAVAAGGGSAYYVTNALNSGKLWQVPVGGGAAITLAPHLAVPGFSDPIAADATSVYWATGAGTLMRLTPK